MNCPICNKEISLNTMFCEHCGFEIHELPSVVSDAIKSYEEERVKKYKENWEEKNKKIADLSGQLETSQKECEATKLEMEQQAEAHKQEMEQQAEAHKKEMNQQAETHKNEMDAQINSATSSASEKDKIISEKDGTITEMNGRISQLTEQIQTLEAEKKNLEQSLEQTTETNSNNLNRLNEQIESLKKDLEEAKNKVTQLDGIVRIINDDEELYLPIYNGLNIYGSASSDERNHHQIKFQFPDGNIKPEHFSIIKEKRDLVVKSIDGVISYNNRPIPNTGLIAERKDIKIGNTIIIRISPYPPK